MVWWRWVVVEACARDSHAHVRDSYAVLVLQQVEPGVAAPPTQHPSPSRRLPAEAAVMAASPVGTEELLKMVGYAPWRIPGAHKER